jgi:ABC-type sugar transport system ATPase subunit
MDHGRIQQVGKPRDVFERPANRFVAGFVGLPSMNMLSGSIKDGRFVTSHGVAFELPACTFAAQEGTSVVLGLRPTDLSIGRARPGEASLSGSVSSVEYGGADIFVDLALGDAERLRIRASPENLVSTGEQIEARIPLAALHVFDHDGGSLRQPTKVDA